MPVYPKGVWSFYGPGDNLDAGLAANKGIVGLIIGGDWNTLNPSQGTFDFSTIDAKVTKAKAAGFKVVINIVNSSLATPAWLLADTNVASINLLDPAPGHTQTFCTIFKSPLFWDATYAQARKDLAAASGDHFSSDSAIVACRVGFANYHSNDFNFCDSVTTITCPGGTPQPLNQPQQWLDAGFTETKMAIVGEELIDTFAAHWPNKYITVPIGGLAAGPGLLLTDYSQLARDIEDRIFGLHGHTAKTYANRVSFQRNTLNAKWAKGTTYDTGNPPNVNSDTYIRYMIRKHVTGFFHLAGLQAVEAAVGGFPDCRQGGGVNGPCGSTCTATCVTDNSFIVEESFGVQYYEMFFTDAKNSTLYDLTKAATKAMGGTIRP